MADPIAYEAPTINKAWTAFIPHVPTILLIWVATIAISAVGVFVYFLFSLLGLAVAGGPEVDTAASIGLVLGQVGQLPFSILSSLVGVLLVAVPALHYSTGETIAPRQAFKTLLERPKRYFLAGLLFALTSAIGLLLCVLPGIAVALVAPVYVNKIFNGDATVIEAFTSSFQAVYKSPDGLSFVGLQVIVWAVTVVVSLCTCGLGALVAVPVSSFYLQNAVYYKGLVR
ncbi:MULTISPECIES: hypothetical protein [Synechococcaceae]|uniref:hypothetical protein n=2 Tax=Synechococcales TaxID=1890424 RepID=UPI00223B125C|nr:MULTISPECIES: hypothetical protein [Synechococcaceae]MCT0201422.1 hypothetical protein [Synechococcus sp. CS-603]MCT4364061.1 hypothetical protein [Candidatus Regnicoccus frigidus MAG-AL1]MCT4366366.1 hypothetical protein [Candidatus Regnicoccus frigidus MAG-AL2]